MSKRTVSAYVKGDTNTPDYYRIHQYLNNINGIQVHYHMMLPSRMYHRFVPIRKHNIIIVALLYILIYIRTTFALLKDAVFPPDYLVVNRRIIPKRSFFPIWQLISKIYHNGRTRILWDFDDDILSMGECSAADFAKLSEYATHIIVTHQHLKSLVAEQYQEKVIILPTTDGDLFQIYHDEHINKKRKDLLKHEIILIWVATSANLHFLQSIIPQLDDAAKTVKERLNKDLILKVVCNAPLYHDCKHLIVENIKWSKQAAIENLKNSHIGIMPLTDTEIARGKGGFKLVQYMSIGLPCIGTDVGYNNAIINPSFGCLVPKNDTPKWTDAIIRLSDPTKWESFSKEAFDNWNEKFSFKKNLSIWCNLLNAE